MKTIALKAFIIVAAAFAVYYLFFLCSVLYELYKPSAGGMPRSGTHLVWALQGAAFIFAPTALLTATVLWFVGRRKDLLGAVFRKIRILSAAILLLSALVNFLFFLPVP